MPDPLEVQISDAFNRFGSQAGKMEIYLGHFEFAELKKNCWRRLEYAEASHRFRFAGCEVFEVCEQHHFRVVVMLPPDGI